MKIPIYIEGLTYELAQISDRINKLTDESRRTTDVSRVHERAHSEVGAGSDNNDLTKRVTALEAKVGQLWGLLTEEDNRGRPKVSKFGRSFRGRLK